MTNVSINKESHLNLLGTKTKIAFAVIISYVTSYSANIFDIYFPQDLYSYNKFLVFGLAGIILINHYLNRKVQLKAPGFLWFNIFFGYALLHGLYPGGDRYLDIAMGLLKVYTLFLVIINLFKTRKDYTILGIVYTAVTTIVIAVYYIHAKRYGWQSRITSELLGFFVNANTMSYISTLAFITFMFATRNRRFKGRLLSQLCILAGAATIINANGSIGAAFFLALAVVFTMFKLENAKVLLLSVCIIFIIGYVYYKYAPYTELIIQRIENKIEIGQAGERFYLIRIAFDAFWDKPVWGKGYDSLWVYPGESINHLWYLNVLVAYGILGLLFVFIWFSSIFPVRRLFISRYSTILTGYILIFLLLSPLVTYISMAMAFLYREMHQRSFIKLNMNRQRRKTEEAFLI